MTTNRDELVSAHLIDVGCRAVGPVPADVAAGLKAHKGLRLHQLQAAVAAAVRSSDPAAALRQHLARWREADGWAQLRGQVYGGRQ